MQNLKICKIQIQRLFKDFQAPFLFSSTFKGLEFFIQNSRFFKDFSSKLWTPSGRNRHWKALTLRIYPPWSLMWPFSAAMFLKPRSHTWHFTGFGSLQHHQN